MSLFKSSSQTASGIKDFDYLSEEDLYLDSACQTLRPQQVLDAMDSYYHDHNACGGRVKYEWGRQVDEKVLAARDRLLKFAGKSKTDYVCAFTLNTTYGINLLLGQLPQDKFSSITTSEIEHNSVFLPSITHAKRLGLERKILERTADGYLLYTGKDIEKSVVVVNTTSNFNGMNLGNAKKLVDDVHLAGGIVIFDAAQTMAHSPEVIRDADFDAACFSGHKMYGPSIGGIIIKKSLLKQLELSFIGGGTVEGVDTNGYKLIRDDPASWLEPGLQNFAGIIGLGEAVSWLDSYKTRGRLTRNKENLLAQKLFEGLSSIPSVELLNSSPSSIISFHSKKIDSHKLAIYLSAAGIMARSGYFCCHYYLDGVRRLPPLLRLSIGLNNTETQIDRTLNTIQRIIGGA